MAIIELDSIGKSYADGDQTHHVLSGLSLSVDAGEFVAILGPSGSGKSTLLSIAGLLLSADEGRISIAGEDLTQLSQKQWTRKRLELLGFIGSSELGVGGGVWASCDEEHSELVVGGVGVASGGASA